MLYRAAADLVCVMRVIFAFIAVGALYTLVIGLVTRLLQVHLIWSCNS